jgi:hypothetical protein
MPLTGQRGMALWLVLPVHGAGRSVGADPGEGCWFAIDVHALAARLVEGESAAERADDRSGRPGQGRVRVAGGPGAGMDLAGAGGDDYWLVGSADLDGYGGLVRLGGRRDRGTRPDPDRFRRGEVLRAIEGLDGANKV